MFFFYWQHFFPILELSDREQKTCDVYFVQQYYSSQKGLCLQVKEILVSFYVHQHQFVKFQSFFQEEGTRAVSCVHQHCCIKFEFFFSGVRDC
jgi:hypothetical protein